MIENQVLDVIPLCRMPWLLQTEDAVPLCALRAFSTLLLLVDLDPAKATANVDKGLLDQLQIVLEVVLS